MRPPGFDATSVATSRCTSGIEYAPAVKGAKLASLVQNPNQARVVATPRSCHVDLDDVRRAGEVDCGARCEDDTVAGIDGAAIQRRLDRARPQILDVVARRHQHGRHTPLERHLLYGRLVVREADDRPPRTQP